MISFLLFSSVAPHYLRATLRRATRSLSLAPNLEREKNRPFVFRLGALPAPLYLVVCLVGTVRGENQSSM